MDAESGAHNNDSVLYRLKEIITPEYTGYPYL